MTKKATLPGDFAAEVHVPLSQTVVGHGSWSLQPVTLLLCSLTATGDHSQSAADHLHTFLPRLPAVMPLSGRTIGSLSWSGIMAWAFSPYDGCHFCHCRRKKASFAISFQKRIILAKETKFVTNTKPKSRLAVPPVSTRQSKSYGCSYLCANSQNICQLNAHFLWVVVYVLFFIYKFVGTTPYLILY